MSPGGRADAASLRRVIAQIEAKAGVSLAAGARAARVPLAPAFDFALGGGLEGDGLNEIVPAQPQDGPAATAFALALAARFLDRRPGLALLIGEAFASLESGALYGPGLLAHGLQLRRLLFVSAPDDAAAFWAIEEALKSGAPAAVMGEIWSLRRYGLMASRRLLIAARRGGTPALLVLAGAYGQAGETLDRRHDSLRDRRRAKRENSGRGRARSPRALRLPGPARESARDWRRDCSRGR